MSKNILIEFWSLFKNVNPCDQTTRKRNLFDLPKEYCGPGRQTHIAVIDNRFYREIEKSFCAGKVYPNTLFSENTSPQ